MYGFDTYDHATCVHFHYSLNMKLSTCLQLVSIVIPIGTTSCAIKLPLCKHYNPIFCHWCSIIVLMIFHYTATHNIKLAYIHIKP